MGAKMNVVNMSIWIFHIYWNLKTTHTIQIIMSITLEQMRKDYKDDKDIMNELTNSPEAVIDFDRTWNGKFEFVRCGECNGPMLGHRAEKCRKNNGYEEALVKKYETQMRSSLRIREIAISHINKQKMAEMTYKQEIETKLAQNLPAKTN